MSLSDGREGSAEGAGAKATLAVRTSIVVIGAGQAELMALLGL